VGICARAGAAIDTDSSNIIHSGHVALQRKGVKRLIRQDMEIYPQMAANRERIALREGAPGD
jgi:hypothetical protein